jgi:hypothetical protein
MPCSCGNPAGARAAKAVAEKSAGIRWRDREEGRRQPQHRVAAPSGRAH